MNNPEINKDLFIVSDIREQADVAMELLIANESYCSLTGNTEMQQKNIQMRELLNNVADTLDTDAGKCAVSNVLISLTAGLESFVGNESVDNIVAVVEGMSLSKSLTKDAFDTAIEALTMIINKKICDDYIMISEACSNLLDENNQISYESLCRNFESDDSNVIEAIIVNDMANDVFNKACAIEAYCSKLNIEQYDDETLSSYIELCELAHDAVLSAYESLCFYEDENINIEFIENKSDALDEAYESFNKMLESYINNKCDKYFVFDENAEICEDNVIETINHAFESFTNGTFDMNEETEYEKVYDKISSIVSSRIVDAMESYIGLEYDNILIAYEGRYSDKRIDDEDMSDDEFKEKRKEWILDISEKMKELEAKSKKNAERLAIYRHKDGSKLNAMLLGKKHLGIKYLNDLNNAFKKLESANTPKSAKKAYDVCKSYASAAEHGMDSAEAKLDSSVKDTYKIQSKEAARSGSGGTTFTEKRGKVLQSIGKGLDRLGLGGKASANAINKGEELIKRGEKVRDNRKKYGYSDHRTQEELKEAHEKIRQKRLRDDNEVRYDENGNKKSLSSKSYSKKILKTEDKLAKKDLLSDEKKDEIKKSKEKSFSGGVKEANKYLNFDKAHELKVNAHDAESKKKRTKLMADTAKEIKTNEAVYKKLETEINNLKSGFSKNPPPYAPKGSDDATKKKYEDARNEYFEKQTFITKKENELNRLKETIDTQIKNRKKTISEFDETVKQSRQKLEEEKDKTWSPKKKNAATSQATESYVANDNGGINIGIAIDMYASEGVDRKIFDNLSDDEAVELVALYIEDAKYREKALECYTLMEEFEEAYESNIKAEKYQEQNEEKYKIVNNLKADIKAQYDEASSLQFKVVYDINRLKEVNPSNFRIFQNSYKNHIMNKKDALKTPEFEKMRNIMKEIDVLYDTYAEKSLREIKKIDKRMRKAFLKIFNRTTKQLRKLYNSLESKDFIQNAKSVFGQKIARAREMAEKEDKERYSQVGASARAKAIIDKINVAHESYMEYFDSDFLLYSSDEEYDRSYESKLFEIEMMYADNESFEEAFESYLISSLFGEDEDFFYNIVGDKLDLVAKEGAFTEYFDSFKSSLQNVDLNHATDIIKSTVSDAVIRIFDKIIASLQTYGVLMKDKVVDERIASEIQSYFAELFDTDLMEELVVNKDYRAIANDKLVDEFEKVVRKHIKSGSEMFLNPNNYNGFASSVDLKTYDTQELAKKRIMHIHDNVGFLQTAKKVVKSNASKFTNDATSKRVIILLDVYSSFILRLLDLAIQK